MAIVNEVITKFSFLGSLTPQTKFNTNLSRSIGLSTKFIAAAAATTAALGAMASSVIQNIAPMATLSDRTGDSVENIQRLSYAAEQMLSSSGAMTSSLQSMNDKLKEFERFGTGGAADAAYFLGANFRDANGQMKTAGQVMADLNKQMQGMGQAEKLKIMSSLGIDDSLLDMLSLSVGEFQRLNNEAGEFGLLTAKQAKQSQQYTAALNKSKFAVSSLTKSIAIGFAPMLNDMADRFSKFIQQNREGMIKGMERLGVVISEVSAFLGRMMPVILGVGTAFAVAWLAAGGFAAIMALLLSPVTLIIAGLGLALLIIDDLMVAMSGGESIIADFFQSFFGIDIVPYLKAIAQTVKDIIGQVIDMFSKNYWSEFFASIGQGVNMLKDKIKDLLPDWVKRLMGFEDSSGGADMGSPSDMLDRATGGTVANSNVNQDVQIQVYGSNPEAIGAAVVDRFQEELDRAQALNARAGI